MEDSSENDHSNIEIAVGSDLFASDDLQESVHVTLDRNLPTTGSIKTPSKKKKSGSQKLGTISGVFLPCAQNILGIILFIRLTWITGQAGTILASVILVCSVGTTFITALSLSALATNGKIPDGGPYYVISRNLGLELGSSIGLMFYLGTTLACSMYCLGAVEAFQATFEFVYGGQELQAVILTLTLASIVYVGVKYVNMASFAFLLIVIVSLGCAVIGILVKISSLSSNDDSDDLLPDDTNNLYSNYEKDPVTGITPSFSSLLALLYPAVTGILAGTNRSGVLESPAKAIPAGTITAILSTFALYLTFIWLFGSTLSRQVLLRDKLLVANVAWPHPLVVNCGIIFSSVGAALQSLVGAPRILSAIANDESIPVLKIFATSGEQPHAAIIFTAVLASMPCLAGNLDFVSPFVTMFMLMMYFSVNMACFFLSVLKTPGFRPTWKYFHWSTALLGMAWTLTLMFVISWYQALLSITIAFVTWLYVGYVAVAKDWGSSGVDIVRGIKFQVACKSLLSISKHNSMTQRVKNWRPQILVFCKFEKNDVILSFAEQLKKNRGGLLEVVNLLVSSDFELAAQRSSVLSSRVRHHGFASVRCCTNLQDGILLSVQASGIGELTCNTVLLGWPSNWRQRTESASNYTSTIQGIIAARKSLIILKATNLVSKTKTTIDIWWILHDGGLLLLIPHILSLHKQWKKCQLRLFTVALESDNSIEMERRLVAYMELLRINAQVVVVEMSRSDISSIVAQRTLDMMAGRQLMQKIMNNSMTTRVYNNNDASMISSSSSSAVLSELFKSLPDAAAANDDKQNKSTTSSYDDVKYKKKESTEHMTTSTTNTTAPIDASRMAQAVRLRQQIREYSSDATLVVMNLPRAKGVIATDFMEYVEVITENLDNVLLLRGSGDEVVTTFA